MKKFKTNKIVSIVMLAVLSLASFTSFAQYCGLQTEHDGFRWERICQDDKQGAKSVGGVTFIPLSRGYTSICYHFFNGGWFGVSKGDKKEGVCDITGREIIAPGRYDNVLYWNEDGFEYCSVELNGKKGICDKNGREIMAPGRYDFACYIDGYYLVTTPDGKEGACDLNGQEIIAPKYKYLRCFDGVFKYKDKSGKLVSTGVKLPKNSTTTTPTPNPAPTPTPQPQPQPQPQPVRQPQPFQVWQACFMCGGSGQCRYCYGYGWAANGKDTCGICHGTGKCSQCAGHGGQNVIEYR